MVRLDKFVLSFTLRTAALHRIAKASDHHEVGVWKRNLLGANDKWQIDTNDIQRVAGCFFLEVEWSWWFWSNIDHRRHVSNVLQGEGWWTLAIIGFKSHRCHWFHWGGLKVGNWWQSAYTEWTLHERGGGCWLQIVPGVACRIANLSFGTHLEICLLTTYAVLSEVRSSSLSFWPQMSWWNGTSWKSHRPCHLA